MESILRYLKMVTGIRQEKEILRKMSNMGLSGNRFTVFKEFLLDVIGRNINKYHWFLNGAIKKFEEKNDQYVA